MFKGHLYEQEYDFDARRRAYFAKCQEENMIEKVRDILIGAFCFGDDGENAEINDFWLTDEGIPMISFIQEDGRSYIERLDWYLDAIFQEGDPDREFIEKWIMTLNLNESTKPAHKRKLILNEAAGVKKRVAVALDEEDSNSVKNFIGWCRTLLKEVAIPLDDPKLEKVFIREGRIFYQGPYLGIKPGKARMINARLQKYARRETFPVGLELEEAQGTFSAPFEVSGSIKIDAFNAV